MREEIIHSTIRSYRVTDCKRTGGVYDRLFPITETRGALRSYTNAPQNTLLRWRRIILGPLCREARRVALLHVVSIKRTWPSRVRNVTYSKYGRYGIYYIWPIRTTHALLLPRVDAHSIPKQRVQTVRERTRLKLCSQLQELQWSLNRCAKRPHNPYMIHLTAFVAACCQFCFRARLSKVFRVHNMIYLYWLLGTSSTSWFLQFFGFIIIIVIISTLIKRHIKGRNFRGAGCSRFIKLLCIKSMIFTINQ